MAKTIGEAAVQTDAARSVDARHIEARDVRGTPADRVAVIIARTAQRHDVSVADILGKKRPKRIVAARLEAVRIVARAFPEFSSPHLGKIFRRHHTSILGLLGRTKQSREARLKREART